MDIAEVVMNPVRQRIIRFLMINGKGTVKEMKSKLNDIPTPSLYRHVKILSENSVILVAEENRVRGTVESVYQLNPNALSVEDDDGLAVQTSLMSIATSYAKYFSDGHANPKKDMFLLTSCTLTLTDDDFKALLADVNELAMKYMSKDQSEACKTRQVTLISSPCNDSK